MKEEYNEIFERLPKGPAYIILDNLLRAEGVVGLLKKRELNKALRNRINTYVAFKTSPDSFLKTICYPAMLDEICDMYKHDRILQAKWAAKNFALNTRFSKEKSKLEFLENLSEDELLHSIMYVLFSHRINEIPGNFLVLATEAFGEIQRRISGNLIPEKDLPNYKELITYSWRERLLESKDLKDLQNKEKILSGIKLTVYDCLRKKGYGFPKDLSAYKGKYWAYDLSGKNLTGFNLEGLYLQDIKLNGATLTNVRIRNSLLMTLPREPTKDDWRDDISEEKKEWRRETVLSCIRAASALDGVVLWESTRFPIKIQMSTDVIVRFLKARDGKNFAKKAYGVISNGILSDDPEMMLLVSIFATLSDFEGKIILPDNKFEALDVMKELAYDFYKRLSSVKNNDYATHIKKLLITFSQKVIKNKRFNYTNSNELILILNFYNSLFQGEYNIGLSGDFIRGFFVKVEKYLAKNEIMSDEVFGSLMFNLQTLEKISLDFCRYGKKGDSKENDIFWELSQSAALLRFESSAAHILDSQRLPSQKINRIFELYKSMDMSALVVKKPVYIGKGFFSRLFDKSENYENAVNILTDKLLVFLKTPGVFNKLMADEIKKLDQVFQKTKAHQIEYNSVKLNLDWAVVPEEPKQPSLR